LRFFAHILTVLPLVVFSQLGGEVGYQSLNVANNPRSAALGGKTISLVNSDISQFFSNPATLDSASSGDIFFNVTPFFADATFYSVAYSFDVKGIENLAAGIHYLNFGSFELIDETGVELGSFSAADYTAFVSKSHRVGPFTLGASLKYLNSTIESYSSSAIAMDFGGVFTINPNWTVAMVFENLGFQLSSSPGLSNDALPLDVRIGTSFKPRYMPLRFTATSNSITNSGFIDLDEEAGRSNDAIDRIFRQINLGAELLLSDNFQFLIGYNHKRKQELRLEEAGGAAGLSYGIMLKVKRFQFRFSRATYHTAGGSSFISLQTNLNDFKRIL